MKDIEERLEELKFISTTYQGAGTYKNGWPIPDDSRTGDFTWRPWLTKEINELTERWLTGERVDLQPLVKRYKEGETELLPLIKNQLASITRTAHERFSYSEGGEIFTNQAGEFSKRIPKPTADDVEDQRLILRMEPFKFDNVDIEALADSSIIEALNSYKAGAGMMFSSWYYRVIEQGLNDLYRVYKRGWRRGRVIKIWREYEKLGLVIDFVNLPETLPAVVFNDLTLNEQRWIALFVKVLPDTLTVEIRARALGISKAQDHIIRKSLRLKLKHMEGKQLIPDLLITTWRGYKDPTGYEAAKNITDVYTRTGTTASDLVAALHELAGDNLVLYCKYKPKTNTPKSWLSPFWNTGHEAVKSSIKYTVVDKVLPRGPKLRKQPPFTNRQLAMLKYYNEFTNSKYQNNKYIKKPFPINPAEFKYKTGICRSSFFPVNIITKNGNIRHNIE